MIQLHRVTKRYKDGERRVDAVAEVNLELPDGGGLFALVGPSGSGKTTLLALMGGLLAPSSGQIVLSGTDITHLRDHHRTAYRKKTVGFVFQELSLIDGVSVLENVLLPLVPSGGARAGDLARARRHLTQLGIEGVSARTVERLSGGQRQRVAIARALMLEPKVLLLDEPTAHLDTESARTLIDHLAALAVEGRTVVAATHDVRVYGDPRIKRVLRLSDGQMKPAENDVP